MKIQNLIKKYAQNIAFEIDEKNIDTFKYRLKNIDITKSEEITKSIEINANELNKTNYSIVKSLAPFGKGFEKPVFSLNEVNTSSLLLSKDQRHIITKLNLNASLIYFNYPADLFSFRKVNLFGFFEINYFNGRISYQFIVKNYEKFD